MAKEDYLSPLTKVLYVSLSYSVLQGSGTGGDWNDTGDE